ncbi:hypothetical protein GM418_14740 [Maribellus comscasis]|uniref:Uncharacterized protein n=1 Tax=Maribellus comscasis TaxID=2681766 RepID=A0A6I6JUW8_9BACT|nr:hypothetical protein [Maribellus comscasis]QGY44880.1 hypothetical protein GM418_14740 [Maribellus comscasis]
MKNYLKIFKLVSPIIFCLFFFLSGQINQSTQKISSTDRIVCSEDLNFICDTSAEIPSFIEEEVEDTDKGFCELAREIFSNRKITPNYLLAEYTNNDILPVVVLIQQTNLPPPILSIS